MVLIPPLLVHRGVKVQISSTCIINVAAAVAKKKTLDELTSLGGGVKCRSSCGE